MFRKAFKTNSHSNLSGKDKKKIKSQVSQYLDEKSIEGLLKDEKTSTFKMQGTKTIIYKNEIAPVLVDSTGKNDFFPTVYALMLCPSICKTFQLNAGVESFILNGANLMWPGVQNPMDLDPFLRDEVVGILDSEGNVVAVGATAVSKNDLKPDKLNGIAVYILHNVGDQLWELGPKKKLEPMDLKNVALNEDEEESEKPAKKKSKKKKESESEEEEEEEEQEDFSAFLVKSKGAKIEKLPPSNPKPQKSSKHDDFDDLIQKKGKKGKKEKVKPTKKQAKVKSESEHSEKEDDDEEKKVQKENNEEEEQKLESEPEIPPKIMDEYLMEALMNALSLSITDKDLPLEASTFYSTHMLRSKKEGVTLDIKNSSYKKIGKFLKHAEKMGILDFHEGKKGVGPQVTKINRSYKGLREWEPTIKKVAEKKAAVEKDEDSEKWPKVVIQEAFKAKSKAEKIFGADYMTIEQAREKLNNFVKENYTIEKKLIVADPYFLDLFPSKTEDPSKPSDERNECKIPKEEVFKRIPELFDIFHEIHNLETGKSSFTAGNIKPISLTAEKSHNKKITKIVGLEQFEIKPPVIAPSLQLKFACSVSTHELPGKNSGKELIIHGNFLNEMIDMLTDEFKVDKKYIKSQNKLEKKK